MRLLHAGWVLWAPVGSVAVRGKAQVLTSHPQPRLSQKAALESPALPGRSPGRAAADLNPAGCTFLGDEEDSSVYLEQCFPVSEPAGC